MALLAMVCPGCSSAPARGPGVVSAATPEAAEAGREILEAGGNAVDAAVAVSMALGVTEPAGSGIGGQTVMLIHPPRGEPVVVNGTSFAPAGIPAVIAPEMLEGRRASTVPSTVRVLDYALRRHGSGRISWAHALEPAVHWAEQGFTLGRFRHRSLVIYSEALAVDPAATRFFVRPDGVALEAGSLLRQPALANTLKRLAEDGADDFYRGGMAREIAADMQANGGWLTLDDLRNASDPIELPALKTTYRGWDVYSSPPPTGGWVVLQILNILERAPAGDLGSDGLKRSIWVAEALRIGHRNRRLNPVRDLIQYAREAGEKIDKARAVEFSRSFEPPADGGETTHFSVVDSQGMAVAVTQSINAYFGSKVAHPQLGFLYNDYMREFELNQPDHPYALRSGAMPYSSMSPTIVARSGEAALVLGSPGSSRIISAVAQVISHWIDTGKGIETAVGAFRLHVVPENELYLEDANLSDSTQAAFIQRAFQIRRSSTGLTTGNLDAYFGGVHAIARDTDGWRGAADPRRDGTVAYAPVESHR